MAEKGKRVKTKKAKTEKQAKKFKLPGNKTVLIAALAVLVIVIAGVAGGAILGHTDVIHPGMVLGDVELGGMTKNEAAAALAAAGWESRDFGSVKVELPAGNSFTIGADEAGLTMDCKEAAEAAYDFGHSGSPVKDLFSYFKCIGGKASVADLVNTGDNKALLKLLKTKTADVNKLLKAGYIVDTDEATLSLIKGAGNEKVDNEKLCDLIISALEKGDKNVKYELSYDKEASFDFKELREKIYAEPVDASYNAKTQEVVKSAKGIDLDVDEAQKLWKSAKVGELVVVPLNVTLPKYNLEDFNGELFSDLLGKQSSNYSSSSASRAANVELAASKINGVILNPGDSFSYNDTVGKRTEAAGFKPAGAYANGKVVNEVGGGICQVSSTLYCAVLYANLDVTARSCHYFPVNYLPAGLDATVSWGGPEFKFVNNRSFPVKIVAKCSNRNLTVEIWGTDVDGSYVEMNYDTATVYDKGAAVGYTADTYRSVFAKDGTLISRDHESHSYYHYHEENIKYPSTPAATKTPEPEASAAPETPAATPAPSPVTPIDVIEEIIDNTPFE